LLIIFSKQTFIHFYVCLVILVINGLIAQALCCNFVLWAASMQSAVETSSLIDIILSDRD